MSRRTEIGGQPHRRPRWAMGCLNGVASTQVDSAAVGGRRRKSANPYPGRQATLTELRRRRRTMQQISQPQPTALAGSRNAAINGTGSGHAPTDRLACFQQSQRLTSSWWLHDRLAVTARHSPTPPDRDRQR